MMNHSTLHNPGSAIQHPDVLIIGGGVVGAALLYELARRGTRTLLLEREAPGAGAASASMGMALWVDAGDAAGLDLARRGLERYATLGDELGMPIGFRAIDALVLAPNSVVLDNLRRALAQFRLAGLAGEIAAADDLARHEPALATGGWAGGLICRQGHVEVAQLIGAYLRAARAHGAEVRADTEVIGFTLAGDRISGIQTTRGAVAAGQVLLAAGAWTRRLAKLLGIELPIYTTHGQAAATPPHPALLRTLLMVAPGMRVQVECAAAQALAGSRWEDWSEGVEAQDCVLVQRADGRIVLGQISRISPREPPPARLEDASRLHSLAAQLVPALKTIPLERTWIAPVPFTPDHQPLIGQPGRPANLWLAVGLKSALSQAPALAGRLAQQILTGRADPLLERFAPARLLPACQTDVT